MLLIIIANFYKLLNIGNEFAQASTLVYIYIVIFLILMVSYFDISYSDTLVIL